METALYLPVKGFLETAGYVVKGEIGGCDLVGLSADVGQLDANGLLHGLV